jgi:gliding motility-associated-like protein
MRIALYLFLLFSPAIAEATAVPLLDFKFHQRCLGDSTLFTDLSCCNIDKWEWDFGEPSSGAANKAYTAVAKHKYSTSGTYTVSLKVGNSGVFTDTIYKQVVICIPEKPILKFHDSTICNGSSIFLYPVNTFQDYYWSTGDTVRTISITDSGEYILCATNCDLNCLVCDTARVKVVNAPVPVLGKFSSTCSKDSFQLNAKNNGFKYLWNTGDTLQKIWAKKDGWYTVKIYSDKCFIVDSTYLVFSRRLKIEFKTDTIACEGDTLYLNPGWGFKQIWWNYTDTNHILKIYNSGIYPLRVFYQGCIIDTFASVSFTSSFPLKLQNDTDLCEGDTIILATDVNASKYLWSNGDTTKSTKIFKAGTVWLRVSFSGCYKTDTVIVKYKLVPVLSPIPKVMTCNGLPGTIKVKVEPGNNFQWWDGNSNTNRTFLDSGWHVYSINNSCFSVTDSAYTGYYPQYTGDSIQYHSVCFEDDTVLFLSAKKAFSYLWRPGNFVSQTINAGKYGWYSVEITDSAGCKEVDSFCVVKKCVPDTLLIPNAFTPNNDGKNEIFKPSYVRHVNYELRIYNRWGELMFKSNDINIGWDGNYKSEPAQEDVYIYLIEVSGYGVFRELKGTVHLIR